MKTNRYINSLVVLIVSVLLTLISCKKEDDILITTISLDENVISLVKGTTQRLIPVIDPSTSSSEIEWSSSNPEVAIVNANGLVQSLEIGKAVINAKIGNSTAFCDVIVTEEFVPVREILVNKLSLDMRIGDVEQFTAEFIPYEATNRKKRWSSSNEKIVSIHEITGIATAHAYGEAVITVTSLDGSHTANCVVSVLPIIELFAPSEENITLHPTDIKKTIFFNWNKIEEIDRYILKVSKTDRFSENDIIFSTSATENSLNITHYDLNEAIREIPGDIVQLYWTIESGTTGIRILPATGRLNLIPDRHEYLLLSQENASGIQLQKMEDPYHYSITANGQSSLNTIGLEREIPVDSGTFVVQYKSNKELSELIVRFKKSNGTTSGTISQGVSASSEWKEIRIPQVELPGGWGKTGDYIQLDFGNVSNYQIELNAINLQKGVYTPEILSVVSWNSLADILEVSENYIKFNVLVQANTNPVRTDPVLNTSKFTNDLHDKAVLLSFEYKSDQAIAESDAFQIYLAPLESPYPNVWPSGGVPASSEWREYTIDMTNVRAGNPWWGKAGHSLRLDPGNYSQGMTMEIRNIQIKFKD